MLDRYMPGLDRSKDPQLPGMGGAFNPSNLALYTYSHQRPIIFLDPNGKWASQKGFYVHQRVTYLIIGSTLDRERNAILASGHVFADSKQFQDVDSSYRHAMRAPGQSVADAKQKADAFVRGQFDKALKLKAEGKEREALFEFAVGLHTLQDTTSPSHYGFQEWEREEVGTMEVIGHALAEMFNPGKGSELYRVTNDAWSWYQSGKLPEGNLFDRYGMDGKEEDMGSISDIVAP